MTALRTRLLAAAVTLLATTASAKPLWVAPTGDDAVSYADNSATRPWRTIGRAVWGTPTRGAPNAAEAAQAGDIVTVAGGTYHSDAALNNRWAVLYDPVNTGTVDAYIEIRCAGICRLSAPNLNAPVAGMSGGGFVRWSADRAHGHQWQITACGRQTATCGPETVNTTPDTGPVVCHANTGPCVIEGFVLDGGPQLDYRDNYDGVRCESSTAGCVVRHNTIRNFRIDGNGGNGKGVNIYCSPGSLVEHNDISGTGTGIAAKDGPCGTQRDVTIRRNRVSDVGAGISSSTSGAANRRVYGNLVTAAETCFFFTLGGPSAGEWLVQNTCVGRTGVYLANGSGGPATMRGNLVEAPLAWAVGGAMPLTSDQQCYGAAAPFYQGPDGARSLTAFQAAFGLDAQSRAGMVALDPVYRPGPQSICHALTDDVADLDGDGDRTERVTAGAYATGTELIGVVFGAPPVDCRVSDWALTSAGPWGACIDGQQTRQETWTRTVLQEPAHGGAACPALTEGRTGTQPCLPPPPPPLGVTATGSTRTCTLVASATPPPDTTAGWGVQFSRRLAGDDTWTPHGTRDTAAPYTRSAAVALGVWEVQAVWSRSGVPSVPVPALAVWACEP